MTTASSHASAGRSPISRSTLLRIALSVEAAEIEAAIVVWELVGVRNSSVEYRIDEAAEEPWPGHDNRTNAAEVVAYLDAGQWRRLEAAARTTARRILARPLWSESSMPERDWRTAWHEYFAIVRIPGPRPLVVRPPHIAYEATGDELVIDLTPALAFGTGQHQSTRLCLRLLSQHVRGGERVLDVGTGSGILAVAAAKLGADSVLAVDIDPLAVDAASQTARQNQLSAQVEVQEGSVPDGRRFDLLTANLTADILQHLAPSLSAALQPGGRLIASGLIAARQADVATAYRAHGLRLSEVEAEDDWRALVFVA